MKFFRTLTKTVFFVGVFLSFVLFSLMTYLHLTLEREYKLVRGERLEIESQIPVTATFEGVQSSRVNLADSVGDTFPVELKLFGAIPFSTVQVEIIDQLSVAVLGHPFGMKLYTDGVLVIDTSAVDTPEGSVHPADEAGLKKGDYILLADGVSITCNEDLSEIVAASKGEAVRLEILRGEKKKTLIIHPAYAKESEGYRLGVWVRDSSAGIGTLTFYSPATGVVCGLGHGICDQDTGSLMTVDSGQMVAATILSSKRGEKGSPGELKGRLTYDTVANIERNCEQGVYGHLSGTLDLANLTEVALKQEIVEGKAQILSTVEGQTPKLYDCTVEKRNGAFHAATQNLVVTVTDLELLETTGGIVQGMSGSPILQNGKLIGAVTHVFIDDPTKGYGIFAENMLETAQGVSNNVGDGASTSRLKDAS